MKAFINKHLNLTLADLYRARKDKSVTVCMIVMAALILILVGVGKVIGSEAYALSLCLSTMPIGFLTILPLAVLNSREYRFNTIRNRLISQNSRQKIYLSALLFNAAVFTVFFAAAMLFYTIFAALIFSGIRDFGGAVRIMCLSYLLYLPIVAMVTFISSVCKEKGVLANVLIYIILPAVISIVATVMLLLTNASDSGLLAFFELFPSYIINGIITVPQEEAYALGSLASLYFKPAATEVLKYLFISAAITAFFTALGNECFKRTDVK